MRVVIKRFGIRAAQAKTVEEAVDLAFSFKSMGVFIAPLQVRDEICQLSRLVADMKPMVVMEIGTAGGGTLYLFAKFSNQNAHLVSVDLPGGEFGGGYPASMAFLFRAFASQGQKIALVRADSHEQGTFEIVKDEVGGGPIDFLFVDGDHTYEGVKKDFEMYFPLIRKGGMIAFHDICSTPEGDVGVPRFWSEIKGRYTHVELVKDQSQGWAGIGVLYL